MQGRKAVPVSWKNNTGRKAVLVPWKNNTGGKAVLVPWKNNTGGKCLIILHHAWFVPYGNTLINTLFDVHDGIID